MVYPSETAARPTAPQPTLSPAPPDNMTMTILDFSSMPFLARAYANPPCFAATIDNAFTPRECDELIKFAESSGEWAPALINAGGGRQELAPETRNCGRILVDDEKVAGALFERIRGLVEREELGELLGWKEPGVAERKWKRVTAMQKGRWGLTRLNERLRFLKYKPGDFFEAHCDGKYHTPDGKEQSFLTFQLYLSPDSTENEGGATRIYSYNFKDYVDVEPKRGRVLVFQHAEIIHSGEKLVSGEKITVRTDFMYERLPDVEEPDFQHYRPGAEPIDSV